MNTHEHVKFWHDAALGDLELLHATYITHTFAPHTHEGYVIGMIEQGAEQFTYHRSKHVAPADSIVFINPGEMHTGSSATDHGWTYRTLYPSTALLQQAASDLVGRPRDIPFFAEPVIHDPELAAEIARTHRAFAEQAPVLEREARLLWTLARLIVRYADDRPYVTPLVKEHRGIDRARSYLEENYAENVSLTQLAMIAQLSPFHLLRLFRSQVSLPPHAYQMQVRITHARQMLQAGMTCVDTALVVGFADQSHFTRHFKRITGVPPGLYREIHQK